MTQKWQKVPWTQGADEVPKDLDHFPQATNIPILLVALASAIRGEKQSAPSPTAEDVKPAFSGCHFYGESFYHEITESRSSCWRHKTRLLLATKDALLCTVSSPYLTLCWTNQTVLNWTSGWCNGSIPPQKTPTNQPTLKVIAWIENLWAEPPIKSIVKPSVKPSLVSLCGLESLAEVVLTTLLCIAQETLGYCMKFRIRQVLYNWAKSRGLFFKQGL